MQVRTDTVKQCGGMRMLRTQSVRNRHDATLQRLTNLRHQLAVSRWRAEQVRTTVKVHDRHFRAWLRVIALLRRHFGLTCFERFQRPVRIVEVRVNRNNFREQVIVPLYLDTHSD